MSLLLNPDYDPNLWKLGYQSRQFGVGGVTADHASAEFSIANPPSAMVTALAVESGDTPAQHVIIDTP